MPLLASALQRAKKRKADAAAAREAAKAAAAAEAAAAEGTAATPGGGDASPPPASSSASDATAVTATPVKAGGKGAAVAVVASSSSSSSAAAALLPPPPPPPPLSLQGSSLSSFDLGVVLGTGSFGKVQLARHRASGRVCALKALSKAHLLRSGQVAHLLSEKEVLGSLSGEPAFVRLLATFQDATHVFLALEFVRGGEFFRHLRARGRLPEAAARAYAAEVVVALEAMHDRGVVYRDLKPENLLLDSSGHLKVTDMGFAKVLPRGGRTYTLCGTPDYIAPEVLLNRGHGKGADWWSFGVLVYETLAGFPPFCAPDPADTYRRIVAGEWACPAHFSPAAKDLVRRLLTADLSQRLGCLAGGAADVRRHAWFKGVDFALLAAARTPGAAAARAARAGVPVPAALGPAVVLPAPPIVPHGGSGAEDDTSNFDDFSGMVAESGGVGGGNGGGSGGGGESGGGGGGESGGGGGGESGGGGGSSSGLGRAEQAQFADF